ncbi:NADH dehydrogenase [Terracoccus luteus]|uniref:NADH dehydrogenase n=1 Tax=Terracoccus luteus TaxID=53356 RepID=A0A495Y2I0_9MICO|nr:FAD-dependent oxidoreductase [Terracoccus luteus]RKT78248.1 NADH dehydrogenase [Terracoccus luteus]
MTDERSTSPEPDHDDAPVAVGTSAAEATRRRRVVVVGGGFGGYFAARRLGRKAREHDAVVELVSEGDAMLYQPLLPDVAVGNVEPRTVAVPLTTTLDGVRVRRGLATEVDVENRRLVVEAASGQRTEVDYDILVLAPGSVSRLVDVPGLAEHAIGFKTVAQAMFLRDHVLGRLQAASELRTPDERRALLTFVVVGAGYAGTELVAQMALLTDGLRPVFPMIGDDEVRWVLLDMAPKVMPELGQHLGDDALALLERRGVDVRLETSLAHVREDAVDLTDGSTLECSTVVWCAGVTGNPLVATLGLPTTKGRLVVDTDLGVPGHPEIYAIGDAAAVPDVTADRDDDGKRPLCAPTAQHAMRQGNAVARNVLADLAGQLRTPYRHRDLGLVVDLGGPDAAARPLGIALKGRLAKLVTVGYHWYALPTAKRRARLLTDWALAGRHPDDVSFGMVDRQEARVTGAEPLGGRQEHA